MSRRTDNPTRIPALKLGFAPHRAALALTAGRVRPDLYRGGTLSPLQFTEIAKPARRPGWVRVAPDLAGICASDRKLLHLDGMGTTLLALYGLDLAGIVPGHEVVGRVTEADAASGFQEGDRVVPVPVLGCRDKALTRCRACEAGEDHRCELLPEAGDLHGGQGFGFNARYGGGWAAELVAPGRHTYRVPDILDDRDAVLAEPMAIAVHAVLRSLPDPADRVLVIGPGPIGLCLVHALHVLRPDVRVTVAGLGGFADERTLAAGATANVHGTRRALLEAIGTDLDTTVRGNRLTGPVLDHGYDVIFDAVGSTQTLDDAFRSTRAGGTVVLVGTATKQDVDWSLVWARELTVRGTIYYGDEAVPDGAGVPSGHRRAVDIAMEVLVEQRPGDMVTHIFPLDDPVTALRTSDAGPAARAIKVAFSTSA